MKKITQKILCLLMCIAMLIPAVSAFAASPFTWYIFDGITDIRSSDSVVYQNPNGGVLKIEMTPATGGYYEIGVLASELDTSKDAEIKMNVICCEPEDWEDRGLTCEDYKPEVENDDFTFCQHAVSNKNGKSHKKTLVTWFYSEPNAPVEVEINLPPQNTPFTIYAQGHISHSWGGTLIKRATPNSNGYYYRLCDVCNEKLKLKTITKPNKKIKVSEQVYTGKNIMPEFNVYDCDGKIISWKNYSIEYENNKNIGTAKVKVFFGGDYDGIITKKFKILPNGTSITKVKRTSNKTALIKWKKQKKQTSGYEVKYSLKKNMKGGKTIKIKSNKKTSAKIKKLKKGKTYYVCIRTYKSIGGKKYYSKWSKVKKL